MMTYAALVTGGTAGIGLASARALAATGRRVYVTGRTEARLEAIAAEGLIGIRADMATSEGIRTLAERLAADEVTLDVLVANAGTAEITRFGTVTESDFDRTFDLNVRGVFFTVQALLPRLADGASVILIGSICGIKGMADLSVYNASKAAVRAFARSWANDLRDRRIRVNTLSPGPYVRRSRISCRVMPMVRSPPLRIGRHRMHPPGGSPSPTTSRPSFASLPDQTPDTSMASNCSSMADWRRYELMVRYGRSPPSFWPANGGSASPELFSIAHSRNR